MSIESLVTEFAERVEELWNWVRGLEPSFAFLLALPFIVAAVGLIEHFVSRRRSSRAR